MKLNRTQVIGALLLAALVLLGLAAALLEIFRMSALPRLVVVLGPTASGKSTLGIQLAEKLGGEILVCDSTQVYRHFDIGTAKVPAAEQRGFAHHLVDLMRACRNFHGR